jgi:hypothetical protein
MLDHGVEQSFHFGEAAKGRKGRRAFLNEEFASRAGLDFFQAGQKVGARNL